MKKILIFFIAMGILFRLCPLSAFAISAQSAVVMDSTSGRILYSHNAEHKMGMASTTKIMTAITALENGKLDSIATVSPTAYGVEGSSMYLVLGEKLSLEHLLYGLMLVSGNDAATAIAEHISGSVDKFASLMNETAQKIGVTNSHFTNPHGLSDENHYTTAHDLAKITAYALKNPKFKEIVSTYKKNVPWKDHDYDRQLVNHNKFLNMYEGCIGVKTGFTKATGRCLVTAVEKNNMTLVCVTLNAPDDWSDHEFLYNNIFANYSSYKVKSANDIVASAEIECGTSDHVKLAVESDIYVTVPNDINPDFSIKVTPYEGLRAPVYKGNILGSVTIESDGISCGEFPVIAAEDIPLKTCYHPSVQTGFIHTLKKVFRLWLICFR